MPSSDSPLQNVATKNGDISGNQYFLLFPQHFLPFWGQLQLLER